MRAMTLAVLSAAAVLLGACGGAPPPEREPVATRSTEPARRPARDDGAQITGIMGTIPREAVERTLNPRTERFLRCVEQRLGAVPYLAGSVRFAFRIRTDGSVAWVHAAQTDMGDRATEQCVLEIARAARFPAPRGGEAEFTWSFSLEAAEGVQPPQPWTSASLGERAADVAVVAQECGVHGAYRVTAYVEPGGRVLAAGGSAPSADLQPTLDCVLERVRAWTMPDPGAGAAKITFTVQ
jgi:hypothetical protein